MRLLPAVWLLMLLGGCGERSAAPPPAGPSPSQPAAVALPQAETVGAKRESPPQNRPQPPPESPPKESSRQTPEEAREKPAAEYHWPADFKLPLEIHIDVPDPPEEITRPSPPIQQDKQDGET
jgi:hypothetical protein